MYWESDWHTSTLPVKISNHMPSTFQVFVVLFSLGLLVASRALLPHDSLAGLSAREVDDFIRTFGGKGAQPIPPPETDTSSVLVNDWKHPWLPALPGQARGPCPGLNALASHGWLPRSGVATPGEIVTAVQRGFNMGWDLAVLVTYAAMLVDGNHVTNLLSIGQKSTLTGPDPPKPATAGGLNTHGVFEGDASLTRGDAFFGDNHNFNEKLFKKFVNASKTFGGGKYNLTVAAEFRYQRIQESLSTNPEFFFALPRYPTAYAEAVFPVSFFVDGRTDTAALDMEAARGFFQLGKMPHDFHRREGSFGLDATNSGFGLLTAAHVVAPGANNGVGNYTVNEADLYELTEGNFLCAIYNWFVNKTVELYPHPTDLLRASIVQNLDHFYQAVKDRSCDQKFPYN